MFAAADLLLLNKIDLLPHLQFDIEQCIAYARRVKPGIQVLQVSATTGEGMQLWYQWLRMNRQMRLLGHPALNAAATASDQANSDQSSSDQADSDQPGPDQASA